MNRASKDQHFMAIARLVARQTTCPRRAVGCVLVDQHHRILATGYNGVPAGAPHCIDTPCPGAGEQSGQGLNLCEAIHAEQNAILFLSDPFAVHTAFVTTFPCDGCIKLFLGTSCQHIVYHEPYPGTAFDRWEANGRSSFQLTDLSAVATGL